MGADIFFIIGILLMVFAAYKIGRIYLCMQKKFFWDTANENHIQMAVIFYIAAFCVPISTISIVASIIGNGQIAIGVVVGSNISLLLLCRGVSYMAKNISHIMNTDIMFLITVSVVLLFLSNDTLFNYSNNKKMLSTVDGIVLILLGVFFIIIKLWRTFLKYKIDKKLFEQKYKFIVSIILSITGGIIYIWNISKTSIFLSVEQNKISILLSGTLLTTLLIISFYIAKNVESVEKNVDNNGLLVQLKQKYLKKREKYVQKEEKNAGKKKYQIMREIENVDKIEETGIILIGIIELTFIIGVSIIIQNIQIPLSNVNNMVLLCAVYIVYCLMSNLPDKCNRLKGSIMITCFLSYIIYGFFGN